MLGQAYLEQKMRTWRRSLAGLLLLAGLGPVPAARAGMLVEALFDDVPLRLETGSDHGRVLVTVAGEHYLVDLAPQNVYRLDGGAPTLIRAGLADDGASALPYVLDHWSAGPPVAGHASTYHVLQIDEQICGEVLASAWMTPFLEPVVRSLELMQRVAPALRPVQRESCGAIPFTVYARNGWPLMAGWRDEAAFLTQTVRFDHYPDDARFARPGDTVD